MKNENYHHSDDESNENCKIHSSFYILHSSFKRSDHSSFNIVFRQHIIIERFQFWQSQILHGVLYFSDELVATHFVVLLEHSFEFRVHVFVKYKNDNENENRRWIGKRSSSSLSFSLND